MLPPSFAFLTVTDYAFFPGTLATVNSVFHFHPTVPVYVVQNEKRPLSAPQAELLRRNPQVILLNSSSLAREGRYINAWELKAYATCDLCEKYEVIVGIDSDCLLCSPVEEQVLKAHQSGGWADYGEDYRVYGIGAPAKNPKLPFASGQGKML